MSVLKEFKKKLVKYSLGTVRWMIIFGKNLKGRGRVGLICEKRRCNGFGANMIVKAIRIILTHA